MVGALRRASRAAAGSPPPLASEIAAMARRRAVSVETAP